jgi:hypothetical protein
MNRRSFFGLILACLGLSKFKAKALPIHTSGYLQVAGRDYIDEFAQGPFGCPQGQPGPAGMSASDYMMAQQKAFSNRLLSRYEGRPIPQNVIFAQNVGRAKPTYGNTINLETQKLKSTTHE